MNVFEQQKSSNVKTAFSKSQVTQGGVQPKLWALGPLGSLGPGPAHEETRSASSKVRKYSKPIIEILAGIPTVVYGFFAALTVGPFFRELGENKL